ncbi:hypothetical protein SCHAM137S_02424 [Streptomyces chartreusis]
MRMCSTFDCPSAEVQGASCLPHEITDLLRQRGVGKAVMATEAVTSVPYTAISAVVRITGLEVAEVKVAVNDLRLPDEEKSGPTGVACVE